MLGKHVIFPFSSINYMFSVDYIFLLNIAYVFAINTCSGFLVILYVFVCQINNLKLKHKQSLFTSVVEEPFTALEAVIGDGLSKRPGSVWNCLWGQPLKIVFCNILHVSVCQIDNLKLKHKQSLFTSVVEEPFTALEAVIGDRGVEGGPAERVLRVDGACLLALQQRRQEVHVVVDGSLLQHAAGVVLRATQHARREVS